MSNTKVILISGKAQNGKDTVAQMMYDTLQREGKTVLITHYADLLKYICRTFFGWNGVKDERGRQLLQYVGTDVIRKKQPDLWVDFVALILRFFGDHWDFVIIPDCRFPNEVDTIRTNGFSAVHLRVVRDGFTSPLTAEQQKHPSETALDGIEPDFVLHNDGTLTELRRKVDDFIKAHLFRVEV